MTTDTTTGTQHNPDKVRWWTSIGRVMLGNREVGGTRQPKDSAEVHAHVLDQHGRVEQLGAFKTHETAGRAVVAAWKKREAP